MATKKAAKKPTTKTGAAKKATGKKAAVKRPAARKTPAKKAATKATAKKGAKKAASRKSAPRKAAFGRPGTAGKGEGDAAVRAWMRDVKPGHRPIVERLDALIGEVVPDVKRAVKWSMPMYGREGMGFFAHVGAFKEHVRLGFFLGTDLQPPPPEGESKGMRSVHLRGMGDFDEPRFRSWIRQAASMKGWAKV